MSSDSDAGAAPIKGAVLKGETGHGCPACDAGLSVYTVYDMEIEGCPECQGVFLGRDELRTLKDKAESGTWRTLSWMDDEVEAIGKSRATRSPRSCPKCPDERMLAVVLGDSGVAVDWCPECRGTWLDGGEFARILGHLREELTKMSSGQAAEELLEELKEVWSGPESTLSELLDVKAAVGALINITIFEHPALFNLCMKARDMGGKSGL